MEADIKLSKMQISEIIQPGSFLGALLSKIYGPLMKIAVSLKNNILAPSWVTAAASPTSAGIQKKIHGSGMTTSIISNEEMNDIWRLFKTLKSKKSKNKNKKSNNKNF